MHCHLESVLEQCLRIQHVFNCQCESLLPSSVQFARKSQDNDQMNPLPKMESSSVLTSFLQVITTSESLLGTSLQLFFCTKESLLVQWLPHC